MPSTMPLRIGDELLSSGRVAAEQSGRSTAQQIAHWAKLGRELERSGSVSVREISEVLAGARAYDELDPKAQAVVRAEWAERVEARLASLDLPAELAAEGRSWVELAPDGTTIRHPAPKPKSRAKGAVKAKQPKAATRQTAAKQAAAAKRTVQQPTVTKAVKKAVKKKATARTR